MSFILFAQLDKKLGIIIPAPECGLTIQEIVEKDLPPGTPFAITESLDGIDNSFFDSYEFIDGSAVVNIDKAKAQHRDRFRSARGPILAGLDVDFMKALEAGNAAEQATITVRKQALRDITLLSLPDTLPEIKATWPEILGPNPYP